MSGEGSVSALKAKFDSPKPEVFTKPKLDNSGISKGGASSFNTVKQNPCPLRHGPKLSPLGTDQTASGQKKLSDVEPLESMSKYPGRRNSPEGSSCNGTSSAAFLRDKKDKDENKKDSANEDDRDKTSSGLRNKISKINIPTAFANDPSAKPRFSRSESTQLTEASNKSSLPRKPKGNNAATQDFETRHRLRKTPTYAASEEQETSINGSLPVRLRQDPSLPRPEPPPKPGVSELNKDQKNKPCIIKRDTDGKRFILHDWNTLKNPLMVPAKPAKINDLAVIEMVNRYANPVKSEQVVRDENWDNSEKRPVSIIPTMTEDEEEEVNSSSSSQQSKVLTSCLPPPPPPPPPPPRKQKGPPTTALPAPPILTQDEEYSDVINQDTSLSEAGQDDEIYEPLDDIKDEVKSVEQCKIEKKREQEKLDKKRKEKEEKEKKKLDKEQKKKEKEIKKFKLDGTETVLGEGEFKEVGCKGSKYDLALKKGDKIYIIRMTNNPSGKWLAKNEEGSYGYVESHHVKISVSEIKGLMEGSYANFCPGAIDDVKEETEADGEIYEDTSFM